MLSRPHAPPDLECPCGLCALRPSELALRLAGEVQQRDLPVGKLPPEIKFECNLFGMTLR